MTDLSEEEINNALSNINKMTASQQRGILLALLSTFSMVIDVTDEIKILTTEQENNLRKCND